MKVTIETAGRAGYLLKYITIYSNDRQTPAFTLSVSLDVVPQQSPAGDFQRGGPSLPL